MHTITKEVLSTAFGLWALGAAFSDLHAQEFTFYGALTSDYVYRGVSNSDEHAAVQLGLDIGTDIGFFGGIWASSTDITTGDRNRAREVDFYFGYVHYFENDWSASLSVNRYTYPVAEGNVAYDYNEWAAIIGFKNRLWFEVDYTDSVFGHDKPAYNLEVLASWPLPASLGRLAAPRRNRWERSVLRFGWARRARSPRCAFRETGMVSGNDQPRRPSTSFEASWPECGP